MSAFVGRYKQDASKIFAFCIFAGYLYNFESPDLAE